MIVSTESGTLYEFNQGFTQVRRVPPQPEGEMRRDGDWIHIKSMEPVELDKPLRMQLEPLFDSGDLGPAATTLRVTTPVTMIMINPYAALVKDPWVLMTKRKQEEESDER